MADEADKAPADPTAESAKQTREAAKWIVSSFAAVGAVLIGSASIKDLSNLTSDGKTHAVGGIAVALVGVLMVIVPFGRVLASARTSVIEVARASGGWQRCFHKAVDSKHYTILAGFPTVSALLGKYALYQYERTKAYNAQHLLSPSCRPTWVSGESDQAFENAHGSQDARLDAALAGLAITSQPVDNLLDFAAAEGIRHRFRQALCWSIAGIVLAGAGAVTFATAETTKDAEAAKAAASPVVDLAKQPVAARLVVDESAESRFAPVLGKQCDLSNVLVSVTASSNKSLTMLVLPQDGCTSQAIKVKNSEGHVESLGKAVCFDSSASGPPKGVVCK
jgi:hypothetical protein